jgi:large conductance mechanosensitive channel
MGFWQEFREFAVKGNAVDMAVGIILGAAFNKIVTPLVNDVVMPPVGLLAAGADLPDLALVLRHATDSAPAVTLRYDAFVNSVSEFLIVALSVYVVVRVMNRVVGRRAATRPAG